MRDSFLAPASGLTERPNQVLNPRQLPSSRRRFPPNRRPFPPEYMIERMVAPFPFLLCIGGAPCFGDLCPPSRAQPVHNLLMQFFTLGSSKSEVRL